MMKKIVLSLLLIGILCSIAYGLTYTIESKPNSTWWSGSYRDFAWRWAKEIEDILEEDAVLFNPTDTEPTSTEGRMYYNNTAKSWQGYNGTSWQTFDVAGGGTLDAAYDSGGAGSGKAIAVEDGAVALTTTDADAASVLTVTHSGAADGDGITITVSGSSQDAIEIENTATGYDIEGTGALWYATKAGLVFATGIQVNTDDLTFNENGAVILNDTDGEIQFADASEDVSMGFGTGNTLTWTTDTAVATVAWGDLDAHTGLTDITGDAADFTLQITADASGEDLLIQQAGSQDASLDLRSAGTGADAIIARASAGGIDIDSVDDLNIANTASTSADDFLIRQVGAFDSSLLLTSAGTGTDAVGIETTASAGDIKINSGDMLDIDAADDINIDLAGAAGEDITVTNTGGSIIVTATENDQGNIDIQENGGTSGRVRIYANQGTGASATTESDASVQLLSDDGGISLYTTGNVAEAVRIETNGGTAETITINNLQGTGTGAVTIAANAAGGDLNLDSVLGRIEIEAEEDVANAVYIIADGSTASTIEIFNDTGTSVTEGAHSVQLLSDVGGIELLSNANLAKAVDVMVDGGTTSSIMIFNDTGTAVVENASSIDVWSDAGGICIQSDADLDDAIMIRVDGGTTSEMTIHNDQGTAADSIEIISDAGGIDITAEDTATGDILIDANDVLTLLSTSIAAQGIYVHANGGTAETIQLHADQGTSATSIYLKSDAGGIRLLSDGASNGDIDIDCEDDMTLTAAGDFTLAVTGATTLPNDVLLKVTVAIADTEMDNLAGTQKELVAAVAGNTIEFVSAIFALDWATTAWTEPSAPDDLVIRYENGTGAIVSQLLDATGFATATEDTVAFLTPTVANAAGAAVASVAVTEANSTNKALVLDNTGAEWTNSGDSQVSVIVYYRLHTTAELGL